MKIAYDAQLNYKKEEGKLNFTTSEYMQETQALLTPSISYSNASGLSLSASASMNLSRYDLTHDGRTRFHIMPSAGVQYQLNATSDIQAGYRLSYSVMPFHTITSLPYYASYSSQIGGNGKWNMFVDRKSVV